MTEYDFDEMKREFDSMDGTYDFDEMKREFDSYGGEEPKEQQGYIADLVDSAQKGAYGIAGDFGESMTQMGKDDWGNDLKAWAKKNQDIQDETISDESKRISQNFGVLGDDKEFTAKGLGLAIAGSAASIPAMIAPGMVGAKVFSLAGKAIGMTKKAKAAYEAAEKAGNVKAKLLAKKALMQAEKQLNTVSNAAGYGATGGVMIGGSTASETRDIIDNTPDSVLSQDPEYQKYIQAYGADARERYTDEKTGNTFLQGMALGTLSTGAFGPVMEKLIRGGAGSIKGAIGKGVATEAMQETVEEGGQAGINKNALPYADIDVADRAVTGGLIGGIMGGAFAGGGRAIAGKPTEDPMVEVNRELDNLINANNTTLSGVGGVTPTSTLAKKQTPYNQDPVNFNLDQGSQFRNSDNPESNKTAAINNIVGDTNAGLHQSPTINEDFKLPMESVSDPDIQALIKQEQELQRKSAKDNAQHSEDFVSDKAINNIIGDTSAGINDAGEISGIDVTGLQAKKTYQAKQQGLLKGLQNQEQQSQLSPLQQQAREQKANEYTDNFIPDTDAGLNQDSGSQYQSLPKKDIVAQEEKEQLERAKNNANPPTPKSESQQQLIRQQEIVRRLNNGSKLSKRAIERFMKSTKPFKETKQNESSTGHGDEWLKTWQAENRAEADRNSEKREELGRVKEATPEPVVENKAQKANNESKKANNESKKANNTKVEQTRTDKKGRKTIAGYSLVDEDKTWLGYITDDGVKFPTEVQTRDHITKQKGKPNEQQTEAQAKEKAQPQETNVETVTQGRDGETGRTEESSDSGSSGEVNPFKGTGASNEGDFYGTEISFTNDMGEQLEGFVDRVYNNGDLLQTKVWIKGEKPTNPDDYYNQRINSDKVIVNKLVKPKEEVKVGKPKRKLYEDEDRKAQKEELERTFAEKKQAQIDKDVAESQERTSNTIFGRSFEQTQAAQQGDNSALHQQINPSDTKSSEKGVTLSEKKSQESKPLNRNYINGRFGRKNIKSVSDDFKNVTTKDGKSYRYVDDEFVQYEKELTGEELLKQDKAETRKKALEKSANYGKEEVHAPTVPEIKESAQVVDKSNVDMTVSYQNMLDDIDKKIAGSPYAKNEEIGTHSQSKLDKRQGIKHFKTNPEIKDSHVWIDVKGDGKFHIRNTKEALEAFKKKVIKEKKAFLGTSKTPKPSRKGIEPTKTEMEKRITDYKTKQKNDTKEEANPNVNETEDKAEGKTHLERLAAHNNKVHNKNLTAKDLEDGLVNAHKLDKIVKERAKAGKPISNAWETYFEELIDLHNKGDAYSLAEFVTAYNRGDYDKNLPTTEKKQPEWKSDSKVFKEHENNEGMVYKINSVISTYPSVVVKKKGNWYRILQDNKLSKIGRRKTDTYLLDELNNGSIAQPVNTFSEFAKSETKPKDDVKKNKPTTQEIPKREGTVENAIARIRYGLEHLPYAKQEHEIKGDRKFIYDLIKEKSGTHDAYFVDSKLDSKYENEREEGFKRIEEVLEISRKKSENKPELKQGDTSEKTASEKNTENVLAKESEYHFDLVKDAHRNISNSPSNAATIYRDDYIEYINNIYNNLSKQAENKNQKTILNKEITQLKEDYLENEKAHLSAKSNTVSWHIAGRSNFNKHHKNQDRNNSQIDKTLNTFLSWRKKQQALIEQKIKQARDDSQIESDNIKASNKEYLKIVKEMSLNLSAMISPGMNKAAFRPSLMKQFEKIVSMDSERALKTMEKLNKALEAEGGLKAVIGSRTDLWKRYQEVLSDEGGNVQPSPGNNTELQNTKKEYTIEHHNSILDKANKGNLSLDEFKAEYQNFKDSKDAILALLNSSKYNKKQLQRMSYSWPRGDEKKSELAASVFDRLESLYLLDNDRPNMSFMMGEYDKGKAEQRAKIDKLIENTTQDNLDNYAKSIQEAKAKRDQAKKDKEKALSTPETLEEYRAFISEYGEEKLSKKQLKTYDNLIADRVLSNRKEATQQNAERLAQRTGDIEFETTETVHAKKNIDLFVVKLAGERLERSRFAELRSLSKQFNGYYSRYRGQGAVPGFQFESEADRKGFIEAISGGEVETTKKEKPKDKLRELGQRLIDKGNESLNQDRKTHTARYASQAASAEASAEADIRTGKLLQAIAEDSTYLKGISALTQLEELQRILHHAEYKAPDELKNIDGNSNKTLKDDVTIDDYIQHVEYPNLEFSRDSLEYLAKELSEVKGYKQLATSIRSVLKKNTNAKIDIDKYRTIDQGKIKKYIRTPGVYVNSFFADYIQTVERLEKIGITTLPHLRAAIRELSNINDKVNGISPEKKQQAKIKRMERDLVGRKIEGFFPTPKPIVEQMLDIADIQEGDKVLEPSAGKGDIADAIKEQTDNLDVIELAGDPRKILEAKEHNIVGDDFLQQEGSYDKIIMNPPFEKFQDIDHVRHAYDLLNDGGRVVAIMGAGVNNSRSKAKEFRQWVEDLGGTIEPLPEGSFKSSFRPTGVNTVLVTVDKEAGDKIAFSRKKITVDAFAKNLETDLGLKTLHLHTTNNGKDLKLDTIIVDKSERKKGIGTEALNRIISYADNNGLRVILSPAVKDDYQGTTSRARLVKFYKRFGFKENKGRNKDFTLSESMFRDNKTPAFSRKEQSGSPLPDVKLHSIINRIIPGGINSKTGKDTVILDSFSNFPAAIQKEAKKQGTNGNDVYGVFHNEEIYLVQDHMTSELIVEQALFHEATHGGLTAALNDKHVKTAMRRLYISMGRAKGFNKIVKELDVNLDTYKKGVKSFTYAEKVDILVEELLAHVGEKGSQSIKLRVREVIGAIKDWLIHHGFKSLAKTITANDIAYLAKASREQGLGTKNNKKKITRFMTAYHGTPHKFDKFDHSKMGTGEGAQAYGWGTYLAGDKAVAEWYQNSVSSNNDKFILDGKTVKNTVYFDSHEGDLNIASNIQTRSLNDNISLDEARDNIIEALEEDYRDLESQNDELLDGDMDLLAVAEYQYEQFDVARISHPLKEKGNLYEIDLADEKIEQMLDWDKPLSEQVSTLGDLRRKVNDEAEKEGVTRGKWFKENDNTSSVKVGDKYIKKGLSQQEANDFVDSSGNDDMYSETNVVQYPIDTPYSDILNDMDFSNETTGRDLYETLTYSLGSDKKASKYLASLGIPGIKYLDGSSRGKGEGNSNYVVFDENDAKITKRNDKKVAFSRKADDSSDRNKRIREQDKTIWHKTKKLLKRQLTAGGLLPETVQSLKIERDNDMGVTEIDIGQLNKQLEKAVGKPFHKLTEAEQSKINDALGGKSVDGLTDEVKVAVVAMRQYIDGYSQDYAEILFNEAQDLLANNKTEAAAAKAALLETISNNIGQYVNRSYKAFDDEMWAKKVPDDVLDNAFNYLMAQYQEKADALEEKAVKAETRSKNPSREMAQKHRDKALDIMDNRDRWSEATINTMLKEGTAFDSMEGMIKESKLGAKDLSILKQRKDIAPEIRALLGEYVDPRITFTKSATKMSRLIFNTRFLDKVKTVGEGVFLFKEKDRPADAYKKIASGENYKPLDGYYTFPEVEQAFKDALGKEEMANWYRAIVQVNGLVKYGKTVLSPTTAARNWMSAFFFSMANGHFNMKHMVKSIKNMRQYFKHEGDMSYLKELKQLGVVYDTPYAGEMMKLLDDSRIEDKYLSGKMGMKDLMGMFTKFYQYGDDFWKIIGYENEIDILVKHKKLTREQAKPLAAERIRNTYPTYSMTGMAVQKLRRFPLAGTFVSFPAEIIRTSFNMMKGLQADLKDPDLRGLALRRITGLSIATGAMYAAQSIAMSALGIDDDEEEAIRNMAAPWNKNSNVMPVGRDDKGNLRYFDLSFLDPYNYWKRPINAMLRDQPVEDMIKESGRELLTPFFGEDILFGSIMEIWNNKKESGGRIYNPGDSTFNQSVAIGKHLKRTVQPGVVSLFENTMRAANSEMSRSGKQYNLEDELMAAIGWRVTTFDPKVGLYYKSFQFKDDKTNATRILNRLINDPNAVPEDEIKDAIVLTKKAHEEAYRKMIVLVSSAKKSGMSGVAISRLLRASRVSKRDVKSLLRGQIPKWKPSRQLLKSTIKRSNELFNPKTRKMFLDRRQFILKEAA